MNQGALSVPAQIEVVGDPSTEVAWSHLLGQDPRILRIFRARTFAAGRPATLEVLGTQLGVTRARVKQLEDDAIARLTRRRVDDTATEPIEVLVRRLRLKLGTAATVAAGERTLRALIADGHPDTGLRRAVLLKLAGPYLLDRGFWQIRDTVSRLEHELIERGESLYLPGELDRELEAAGVVADQREAIVAALPLHPLEGNYLLWVGTLATKAVRVLSSYGKPMSRAAIHQAMDSDTVNFRSMVNDIQRDRRIRRVALDRYGLADWGGEEYTTIVQEITKVVERNGGGAHLEEIVNELVERVGVSENSVRSYANSRSFYRRPDGQIAVEFGDSSARVVKFPPELDRDLVLLDGRWTVRVAVDREILRGSGRPVRNAIAQAAGVEPGGERRLEVLPASFRIGWRSKQPAFGSCRAVALGLGAAIDDLIFLPLRDGGDAQLTRRGDLDAAQGQARVGLELGVGANADRIAIATAIGLPAEAPLELIRARLENREQPHLASLVSR